MPNLYTFLKIYFLNFIIMYILNWMLETKLELNALVEKFNTTGDVTEIDSLIFRYTFKRISKFDVSKSEYLQGVEDELGTTRLSLWVFSGVYTLCGLIFMCAMAMLLNRDFPPGLLQSYFDLPWPFT